MICKNNSAWAWREWSCIASSYSSRHLEFKFFSFTRHCNGSNEVKEEMFISKRLFQPHIWQLNDSDNSDMSDVADKVDNAVIEDKTDIVDKADM